MVTSLEDSFMRLATGQRLDPRRHDTYDSTNSMFLSPLNFDATRIIARDRRLSTATEAEVKSLLLSMVRFTKGQIEDNRQPPHPVEIRHVHASDDIVVEYRDWAERELVTYGPLDSLLADNRISKAEKLYRIVSNATLGNSANRNHISTRDIQAVLDRIAESRSPLYLVVPAFPFKDQGAFNTNGPPDTPDFGEVALMVRMHCLALAMSRVHVQYVHWIVVSDGSLYAPMFGLETGVAHRYMQRLRALRDQLNLSATISLLSLQDLSRKTRYIYNSARFRGGDPFSDFCADIRQALETMWRQDEEVATAMDTLTRSTMWNVDTQRYVSFGDPRELWAVLKGRGHEPLASELYEQSRETAFRYAACNIGLGLANVIDTQFPFALRATSHAKPGQVALPRLGHVAPWNGVAARRFDGRGWGDLECMRVHRVWRRRPIRAICLGGSRIPFYYETH